MELDTRLRIHIIITTLVSLLAAGTVAFKLLEPLTWIQAFYFSVSTMTTVGYGDFVPSSDLTRLMVAVYALIAVTLYISLATVLGARYLEKQTEKEREKWMAHHPEDKV